MQDTQAARRADRDGETVKRSLARLRAQIDALDDELLALIEKRLAASRSIAEMKSADPDGHLWLRPRREQEVIARLCRRAAIAPPFLVELLWRELMAFSLQQQVRTELVLNGPDPERLTALARGRFGSAAPVRCVSSPAEALDAAGAGEAVAVIAFDETADWIERLPLTLSIFDWIRDGDGQAVAAAVGRISPAELPAPESER
jgi:chorismate mutase